MKKSLKIKGNFLEINKIISTLLPGTKAINAEKITDFFGTRAPQLVPNLLREDYPATKALPKSAIILSYYFCGASLTYFKKNVKKIW